MNEYLPVHPDKPIEQLTQHEKRAYALRLKVAGRSFAEVARALKVTTTQARTLIRQGMAEALGFDLKELRDLGYLRCEHLIGQLMPAADMGDTDAARTIAILQAQQAKMLGLDQGLIGGTGGEIKVTIVRPD